MDGIRGDGNEVHLTNSSAVLTKVLGLISVNLPNPVVGDVNTTDQDSGGIEESMPGTIQPGTFSFVVKYVPGSVTDLLINEHLLSREKRGFEIHKTAVTPTREESGTIYLNSYTKDTSGTADLWTATVTAKISGSVSEADAA